MAKIGWGDGKAPKYDKKAAKAQAKQAAKCRGGKCKNGVMCVKHSKGEASKWTSAHNLDYGVKDQRRPDGERY